MGVRRREYFGHYNQVRPEGVLIWFRSLSVGESVSILPLIEQLKKRQPDLKFLVTTDTKTSASILQKHLPDGAFHQFSPIDSPSIVRRFFDHWQPDIAISIESCFWPNQITMAKKRSIPMMLINAHMSEKSYRRWKSYAKEFFQTLLRHFSFISVQSPIQKEKFSALGINNIDYYGNLKFASSGILGFSKTEATRWKNIMGKRPCWLAASIHMPEEEFFAQTHAILKKKYPDLLSFIAPRHPVRGREIANLLCKKGFSPVLRSKNQLPSADNDVYIADTIGDMGLWYHIHSIVAIGKSWVGHGGHNPIEPARMQAAILCGPHMENFQPIIDAMMKKKAVIICDNQEQLPGYLSRLIDSGKERAQLAKNARDYTKTILKNTGVDETTDALLALLPSDKL